MARKDWMRTDRQHPCPVCSLKDHPRFGWCLLSRDGKSVICSRVMSNRIVGTKGAGWLHRLIDPLPKAPDAHPVRPIVRDWRAFAQQCVESLPDQCDLGRSLGVSDESLGELQLGWSNEHGAYTFPMRDGKRTIIGIRTRYRNGTKRAVPGSRNGLFVPLSYDSRGEVWVCEGPTDCAALVSVGMNPVGRPSSTGGRDELVTLFRDGRAPVVNIICDRDKPGSLAEGFTTHGTDSLATALREIGKRCRIIKPTQHKDVREWVQDGAGRTVFESLARNTCFA